ncbi:hypothetical protein [Pendulispora albinea]
MLNPVTLRAATIWLPVLAAVACSAADPDAWKEAEDAELEGREPVRAEMPLVAHDQDDVPLASAIFRATHNSYSGDVEGAKGPILGQLDRGVRFLELDVYDLGFASARDYSIGHNAPGDAVDHGGGNPATNKLRDWLAPIGAWSRLHPDHAPLMVMLDVKGDFTDNASFAEGNLAALNEDMRSTLGAPWLFAKDLAAPFPTIGELRGRILTLLSGDGGSRAAYKRDVGHHPAVAINGRGQVVEVHDSGSGTLWYWTGQYEADGRVTWRRHGRYDTGKTPAVALNDQGFLVEVHQAEHSSTLWYHVGRLGSDGEIAWSPSRPYDLGVLPTVRFVDPAGAEVREVHRSQANEQNWDWEGTLNTATLRVAWNGATHGRTSDPRFDVATASHGTKRVSVWTGADGASPPETLRYTTDRISGDRIRYPQWAFVEFQPGDSAELREGAWFHASNASNAAFITAGRREGRIVRGWDFDDASRATEPLANYPATNTPWAPWYQSLLNQAGAISW